MTEELLAAEKDARVWHYLRSDIHTYSVPVSPKSLLETLCVVEFALNELGRQKPGYNAGGTIQSHLEKVRELMAECQRKRPTGSDGKHGDRHTHECGCVAPYRVMPPGLSPHDKRGRLDRSICGGCNDAYVECSKCGVYLCECTRSETCPIPPASTDEDQR